ncbi:MAG: hypothetical protein RJB38_764 [Pseudomonadota bacterium]|jgi:hypothetical protein
MIMKCFVSQLRTLLGVSAALVAFFHLEAARAEVVENDLEASLKSAELGGAATKGQVIIAAVPKQLNREQLIALIRKTLQPLLVTHPEVTADLQSLAAAQAILDDAEELRSNRNFSGGLLLAAIPELKKALAKALEVKSETLNDQQIQKLLMDYARLTLSGG